MEIIDKKMIYPLFSHFTNLLSLEDHFPRIGVRVVGG